MILTLELHVQRLQKQFSREEKQTLAETSAITVMEMTRDGGKEGLREGASEEVKETVKGGIKDALGLGDVSFEKPSVSSMVGNLVDGNL